MKKVKDNNNLKIQNGEITCRGGRLCPPANAGITLVALVVTIIVLIILAGVTLNIALDQNGIIGKAEQGTADYQNAEIQEQDALSNLEWLIGDVTVPIPAGYVKSEIAGEKNIADGLVIYQKPEGATIDWTNKKITINGEIKDLQENTNQYVWIPVSNINDMVMCKKNGQTGTDGKTICNLVLEGEELKCTTHNYITSEELTKTNLAEDFEQVLKIYDEDNFSEMFYKDNKSNDESTRWELNFY